MHRIEIETRMITELEDGEEILHQTVTITENCLTPQEFCWKAPRLIGAAIDSAQAELNYMANSAMKGETPWEQ